MLVHLFSLEATWHLDVRRDFGAEQTSMYEIYICMQKADVTEKACVFQSITNLKAELHTQRQDLTPYCESVIDNIFDLFFLGIVTQHFKNTVVLKSLISPNYT